MSCFITLNLQDVADAADFPNSNLFVRFELKNYGLATPQVAGAFTLVPTFKDFFPDDTGLVQGTIVGNDTIIPVNTYYTILYYSGGTLFHRCDVVISGATMNLNGVLCLSELQLPGPPPVPAPYDLNYLRLDAGNQNLLTNSEFVFPTLGALQFRVTQYIVPFSTTPTFNAANGMAQIITLTNNVISSTFLGGSGPCLLLFIIKQDSIGFRTFTWPPNVFGSQINFAANTTSYQLFYWDGTNAIPVAPMNFH